MRLDALFRLAFASAPSRKDLASPHTITRRSIKQKVRSQPFLAEIGLLQLVGGWFQVLLTPLEGVLFTFQSPYLFTIGRTGVLSLAGWSPHVQSGFHEPRLTHSPLFVADYRTVTFYGRPFQDVRLNYQRLLGWSAFARRY